MLVNRRGEVVECVARMAGLYLSDWGELTLLVGHSRVKDRL
jgi:hypothetical protein